MSTIHILPLLPPAARFGTALANHVEVLSLTKSVDEKCEGKTRISGAICRDVLTGEEFTVKAKTVINATGPFTGLWVGGLELLSSHYKTVHFGMEQCNKSKISSCTSSSVLGSPVQVVLKALV